MTTWRDVAEHAIRGLGVRPGELIQVREHTGRLDVILEMLLAIERAGATPLLELTPPIYIKRLLDEAPLSHLLNWDEHRIRWMEEVDRVLVLQGAGVDANDLDPDALDAWSSAVQRLTALEEERHLPYMLVAVPTEERAQRVGMSLRDLEAYILPALVVPVETLRERIQAVLNAVYQAQTLTIITDGHELYLHRGRRRWLTDDGYVDEEDRITGAITSNLPAGSVYTTVIETATTGTLRAHYNRRPVLLTFKEGVITEVEGAGADAFLALLERHTGDCRRVGHVGVGLNPALDHPIQWTVIDEHVAGAVFISLGENRYMGGQNASSLNIDLPLERATLLADQTPIVREGRLVV